MRVDISAKEFAGMEKELALAVLIYNAMELARLSRDPELATEAVVQAVGDVASLIEPIAEIIKSPQFVFVSKAIQMRADGSVQ